jgi:hypothetical protein
MEKKKSPSAESNLPPPVPRSDALPTAPTPPPSAATTAVGSDAAARGRRNLRADVCERTRFSTLAKSSITFERLRRFSRYFFCSVSPTRRAPYCREFRASVPRRRRVRRRAASVDWPFCRLAQRVVPRRRPRRPNRSSDRNEIFRRRGRRVAPSDRRVSSLSVDGDRSADGSEGCPRIVRFSTFSLSFSNLTCRPTGPDRRRSRLRVGRLRPRPSDVVSTGVAAGFLEPSSKNAVFTRFPIFFPPPTGPCASEVKAAWHRDAPRPPASAAGSPAWYAVGIFCGG